MKNKIIYFSLVILMCNVNYEVNYAENDTKISNNDKPIVDKVDDLIADVDLKNTSSQGRTLFNFKWGTADCNFDDVTGELFIGGGEIPENLMGDETPLRSSTKYIGVEPERIRKVSFTDKLILRGSAKNFFEANINCISITGLDYLDTTNVYNMEGMFANVSINESIDISSWNTANVTNMARMFVGAGSANNPLKLTLGENDLGYHSSLTTIEQMFYGTYFDKGSNVGQLFQKFDTSNVTNMNQLFSNAINLNKLDLSDLSMDNVTQVRSMFDSADIDTLLLPYDKPKKLTNMQMMFQGLQVQEIDISAWDTSEVTQMTRLFAYSKLKNAPISNFNTGSVEAADEMFLEMENVSEFYFGDGFDTSKIEDMSGMFSGISCSQLDLSFFDTSSLEIMDSMFEGSTINYLSLEGWSNPKLESMDSTFSGGSNRQGSFKDVNMQGFNTSHVTNMEYLFYGSSGVNNFDLSSFDVSSVTSMSGLFRASDFEGWDFSLWDTSKVADMSEMFSGDIGYEKVPVTMNIKTLDLSGLKTDSLKDSNRMFANLPTMEVVDLTSFHSLNDVDTQDMFLNCVGLAKITLGTGIESFPKDINLPEVKEDSIHPTSWISEESSLFFETTNDFINNYYYTNFNQKSEVWFRSFRYHVQYIINGEVKLEQENFYNREVEIPEYQNNRYEVKKWKDASQESMYIPKNKEENIGVEKNSYDGIVKLTGEMGEQKVQIDNFYWKETNNSTLKTSSDIGESEFRSVINMQPILKFDDEVVEEDYLISYKIETYDVTNQKRVLIDTSYETFRINEEVDYNYQLQIESLSEGVSQLEVAFYQLSVEGDEIEGKKPIQDESVDSLFISLTKDRSFSILEHPELLSWEIDISNSKGIITRKTTNDLNFLILNSLDSEKNWDVNLVMDFPDDIPFTFIWKNEGEDIEQVISRGVSLKIFDNKLSEERNPYKHQKSWSHDTGLLIKSDSRLKSGDYSKDVSVRWVLSSNPDFS